MIWFWIGGLLAAVGLTAWNRWIGAGWVRRTVAVPLAVWVISTGSAVFFTWRAFHAAKAADASQKASQMAQNIEWAMNATMAGLIGLGVIAVMLLVAMLRRGRV